MKEVGSFTIKSASRVAKEKAIAAGNQACVAYYHRCTVDDDWGTLNEHWELETEESFEKGHMSRWYTRTKPRVPPDHRNNRRGTIKVDFWMGEVKKVEWDIKPSGCHADPRENYQNAEDDERDAILAEKPEGFGDWA